jgi:hypothetical protein
MKKVMLFFMLGVFTLGSSGFKKSDEKQVVSSSGDSSCLDFARTFFILIDGAITTENIDDVLWLNFQCEQANQSQQLFE